MRMPETSVGLAEFYAPQVMDAQVEYRGLVYDRVKYVGAEALPFCSEIGHDAWLQRVGWDWEGPFLVADCARRNDLYGIIVLRRAAVEVDFDTAVAWHMARYGGQENEGRWSQLPSDNPVTVLVSMSLPSEYNGIVTDLSYYFLEHVVYAKPTENTHCLRNYIPPHSTWDGMMTDDLPMWLFCEGWVTFP